MENENTTKQITVKMLDMDWIFRHGNIERLIKILAETENDTIFSSVQITAFIDLLWQKYYPNIFRTVFLNYLRFFFCTIIYLTFFLTEWKDKGKVKKLTEIFLTTTIVSDLVGFMAIECM